MATATAATPRIQNTVFSRRPKAVFGPVACENEVVSYNKGIGLAYRWMMFTGGHENMTDDREA